MVKAKDSFIDSLLDSLDNKDAIIADDDVTVDTWVDTGSYALNALYSGSIYKGLPGNRIAGLAGEEATGKSFFTIGMVKSFLDQSTKNLVIFYESEGAVDKDLLIAHGVDTKRVIMAEVKTVQEFKTQAIRAVNKHLENKKNGADYNLMLVLDSLGMLSTSKEMEDTEEGKETKDMTRTQIIKAAFRVLTLNLKKANIPLIVTNHIYQTMGSMFPTKEMSGGGGLKYAASSIVFLSKRKEKNADGEVIGNIIHCRSDKSRKSLENKMIDVLLTYDKGLDRYYGLVDIGVKCGILKKLDKKIEFPDGKSAFISHITKNPEKFWTKELLDVVDKACHKEFKYGNTQDAPVTNE